MRLVFGEGIKGDFKAIIIAKVSYEIKGFLCERLAVLTTPDHYGEAGKRLWENGRHVFNGGGACWTIG